MNTFILKSFTIFVLLFLMGCATTPYGRQKQVMDAGAGAVVGGLLGYAIAGSKGAKRGAAAGAAVGIYSSGDRVPKGGYDDDYSDNPGAQAAYDRERAKVSRQRQKMLECEAKNEARGYRKYRCNRYRRYQRY